MSEIRRILFPTDFSDCGQRALREAVWFAGAHGAHLHLLHVSISPDGSMPPTPFPGEAEAATELARVDPPTGVTHHLIHSPFVAPTILDYARDLDIDLIVMGSHGRRGVRRWIVGSVADEVLRGATCPVLLARCVPDRADVTPRRLLVPVDFSVATPSLVRRAAELARTSGAALDVVHVVEMPVYPDFYVSNLALPETRERVRARLAEIAAMIGADVEVSFEVLDGRVTDEISDFAEAHGNDLIVLASRGHAGLKRLVLGSTAEGVARRAPCPVLVLRAGAPESEPETDVADMAATV